MYACDAALLALAPMLLMSYGMPSGKSLAGASKEQPIL